MVGSSEISASELHTAMDLEWRLPVRRVDGTEHAVAVRPSTSIGLLRARVPPAAAAAGTAAGGDGGGGRTRTRLLFGGRELGCCDDALTLADVGVTPKDFIVAVTIRSKKRSRAVSPAVSPQQQQQQQQSPTAGGWHDHGTSCRCDQCLRVLSNGNDGPGSGERVHSSSGGSSAATAMSTPARDAATSDAAVPGLSLSLSVEDQEAIAPAPPPPRPPGQAAIRQTTLHVSRRPVMLLWASAVAFRLGYPRDEALSLAGAVATIFAQFKAKRLGIRCAPAQTPSRPRARPCTQISASSSVRGGGCRCGGCRARAVAHRLAAAPDV
eukprot:COSAG01_NODE_18466_length_1074_cov_0.834872_1_plen_323_part_10